MSLVRLQGMLTPAERKLARVEDRSRVSDRIKLSRLELIALGRPLLDAVVREILAVGVVSLHTDISTTTGESIILSTLDAKADCAAS